MNRTQDKGKPIIFSPASVWAIECSFKTQTRRVAKVPPETHRIDSDEEGTYAYWGGCAHDIPALVDGATKIKAPYRVGDILWVREPYMESGGKYYYRANRESDYLDKCETLTGGYPFDCRNYPGCEGCMREDARLKWRPSIFMPRAAARIFLRVTDVRVERVQDITDNDAIEEGVDLNAGTPFKKSVAVDCYGAQHPISTRRAAYCILWSELNGKRDGGRYAWDKNPWCWCITFERMERKP